MVETLKKWSVMIKASKVEAPRQNNELKIFFHDETFFGRIYDLRRSLEHKDIRQSLKKQIVREYNTYSYGVVCPSDGDSCFLMLQKLNQDPICFMFKEMSERYQNNYLIIVYDVGALAHKIESKQLHSNTFSSVNHILLNPPRGIYGTI